MTRKLTGAMAGLAFVLALLTAGDALAQQQTIYGPDGRVRRITTDSQGSTTIYDASGRVTGRTSTDSQGTTTIYDAAAARRAASPDQNHKRANEICDAQT